MGFNKVFKSLQEVFPLIDARALRAVSIEHSKDVDAAVEAVLEEIIPFFVEKSAPSSPSTVGILVDEIPSEDDSPTQSVDRLPVNMTESGGEVFMEMLNGENTSSHDTNSKNNETLYKTYIGQRQEGDDDTELMFSDNFVETGASMFANMQSSGGTAALTTDNGVNIHQNEVQVDPERNKKVYMDTFPEDIIKHSSDNSSYTLGTLEDKDMLVNQVVNIVQEKENCDTQTITEENDQGKFSIHGNNAVAECASVTVQTPSMIPSQSSNQLVVLPKMHMNHTMETKEDIVGVENECTMNGNMTQSDQINTMGVLEASIVDARSNKKTLLSAIESVISMSKEVELREQAVERAQEESSKGVTHVLEKVDELKQMLKHAKEANEMHAGEVYGEKAILATELKELQSRVIFLSEERDKSLAVLDEMQHSLELRLATAEKEIRCAEQEALSKQKYARKALSDQELIMESVVQDSNILKQQAEENAKLREFLVDRGCAVDVLQGEIAVICQDVKLLKEKFDERVPLSKSISSSQTSCILASSSSSIKSLIPDQVETFPGQDNLVTFQLSTDLVTHFSVDEAVINDRKALLEEGWDLFEDIEK